MKKGKNKITAVLFAILALIIIMGIVIATKGASKSKIVSVSSKKELMQIYDYDYGEMPELVQYFLMFTVAPYMAPFLIFNSAASSHVSSAKLSTQSSVDYDYASDSYADIPTAGTVSGAAASSSLIRSNNDHSTTNVQVENVDEADVNKTDGHYIYSISNQKVLITDVSNPERMEVVGEVESTPNEVPVDLILDTSANRLVVIRENVSRSSYESDTAVTVYDISDVTRLKSEKSFKLNAKYYTSRETNGYLYIMSTGRLREKNEEIDISYTEDGSAKEIDLKNIQYIKGEPERYQTIVAAYKVGSREDVGVHSYLFSLDNAYVSQKNIYLVNNDYSYNNNKSVGYYLKKLFGFKGIFGFIYDFINDEYSYSSKQITEINKFSINNGEVKYVNKAEINGKTLNQFSMDEYNGEFRIALYESGEGSRIVVFDKDLKEIGASDYYEENEMMYSSRFVGNRAYLVTYRNTDPLFVIDLSDGENPRLLGKLEIPGYSTYLHPYDENHIIGIGMNSETNVRRDSYGRVTSTTTQITGMKMALFDVTDVRNPQQISQTLIGDRYTTSAVLDNHKALLFSKEKGIICIPVNTYNTEFVVEDSARVSTVINNYKKYGTKNRRSEGYLVYNIDLQNGFIQKGAITHDISNESTSGSDLLRGVWIGDNLFTISQREMKSSRLSDLKLLDDIDLTTYVHLIVEEPPVVNTNTVGNYIGNTTTNDVVVVSRNEVEG